MGKTVKELGDSISAHELVEWFEYYSLEPWGAEADFLGHAITASVVANANKSPKIVKDFIPADFMPTCFDNVRAARQKHSVDILRKVAKKKDGT